MTAYLIRSTLLLSLFYAFYLIFMRRTTFFRLNRIMLLAGTALCMILPLFSIEVMAIPHSSLPYIELPEVMYREAGTDNGSTRSAWFNVFSVLYMAGAAISAGITILSVSRIVSIIRNGHAEKNKGYHLIVSDKEISSCSFLNYVIISHSDLIEHPAILQHELKHLQFHHSVDILLFSIISVIFWFNPIVWIIRSELKLLHEYEADEAIIRQGFDGIQYQLLLVRKAAGGRSSEIVNGFNCERLKSRISMMQSSRSRKWKRLGYAACIPILLCASILCTVEYIHEDAVPPAECDTLPLFNGQSADMFYTWVNDNLTYPEGAKRDRLSGKVMVSFTINSRGELTDARVVSGIREDLDKEAIRAISSSPQWSPATRDGKPVAVNYLIPVAFQTYQ